MSEYRPELADHVPARMRRLPVHRGYPVPWFVGWTADGHETRPGEGTPDFRVIGGTRMVDALKWDRCWVCGLPMQSRYKVFVLGPMCAVNRTSAEPPSHLECAVFSARHCPFLSRPHAKRREGGLPEERAEPAGIMLRRNPGVALVWVTTRYRLKRDPRGGVLFNIGEPHETYWFCEGREATRAEVEHSIETGLPALAKLAADDGPGAVGELERMLESARQHLPAVA